MLLSRIISLFIHFRINKQTLSTDKFMIVQYLLYESISYHYFKESALTQYCTELHHFYNHHHHPRSKIDYVH